MINERWSYSSLKTFEQCPKKYYHLKIAQDIKDVAGSAALYGTKFHDAAEKYVRGDAKLPKEFNFAKKLLDNLIALKGDKHCELKMGVKVKEEMTVTCDFDDPEYWWHGIADLVVIDGEKAISLDYKTSKNARYADTKQLDAVAVGLFLRFPKVDTIKSGLVFVVSEEFRHKTHKRENILNYIEGFEPTLERLSDTKASGVWNPISGPLCGWCPVEQCEHWRERR